MHDDFEKSWAFYLHNSNKSASIIKVAHASPAEYGAGGY